MNGAVLDFKELRSELLGEIEKTNQRMDSLFAQTNQNFVIKVPEIDVRFF